MKADEVPVRPIPKRIVFEAIVGLLFSQGLKNAPPVEEWAPDLAALGVEMPDPYERRHFWAVHEYPDPRDQVMIAIRVLEASGLGADFFEHFAEEAGQIADMKKVLHA